MNIDIGKTVKNWKWWLILIPAITMLAISMIPVTLIAILEFLIFLIEKVNISKMHSKTLSKILKWVHRK